MVHPPTQLFLLLLFLSSQPDSHPPTHFPPPPPPPPNIQLKEHGLTSTTPSSSSSSLISLLTKACLPVLLVNAIGATLIGLFEGWTGIDALYYSVITSTTIGYGMYEQPTHPPTHPPTHLHQNRRTYCWVALFSLIKPPTHPPTPLNRRPPPPHETAPTGSPSSTFLRPDHPPTHPPQSTTGDLHPTRDRSYWVALFYIPLAVCAIGNCISQLAEYVMERKEGR